MGLIANNQAAGVNINNGHATPINPSIVQVRQTTMMNPNSSSLSPSPLVMNETGNGPKIATKINASINIKPPALNVYLGEYPFYQGKKNQNKFSNVFYASIRGMFCR